MVPEVSLLFDGQNVGTSPYQTPPVSCSSSYTSQNVTNGGVINSRTTANGSETFYQTTAAANGRSTPYTQTAVSGGQLNYSQSVAGNGELRYAQGTANCTVPYSQNGGNVPYSHVQSTNGRTHETNGAVPYPKNAASSGMGSYTQNAVVNGEIQYSQPGAWMQTNPVSFQPNPSPVALWTGTNTGPYDGRTSSQPPSSNMAPMMQIYRPSNGYNNTQYPGQQLPNSQMAIGANRMAVTTQQPFGQTQDMQMALQKYPGNEQMFPGGVRSQQNYMEMSDPRRQTFQNEYKNDGTYRQGFRQNSAVPQGQHFDPDVIGSRNGRPSGMPVNAQQQGYATQRPVYQTTTGVQTFAPQNVGMGQMRQISRQSGVRAPVPPLQMMDNGRMRMLAPQSRPQEPILVTRSPESTDQNQNRANRAAAPLRGSYPPVNQIPNQFPMQRLQSPQGQFIAQRNNNSPAFPRAPNSISPARHQFSTPVGTHSTSPLAAAAGHISESTDSGFQNDSMNGVEGGGQIPQEVYRRLSMQDAELKSLRMQLQELMTRQTEQTRDGGRSFNDPEVSNDQTSKVKGQDESVRSSNAAAADPVQSCSIAVNTSFYWPPSSTNDPSDRTPVSRGSGGARLASPTVLSNNSSDQLSKMNEGKHLKNPRRSDGGSTSEGRISTDGETKLKHATTSGSRQGGSGRTTGAGYTGNGQALNTSVEGGGTIYGEGADSVSLTDMNVTADDVGGDRSRDESNASEMIMDMPGYLSLSPSDR